MRLKNILAVPHPDGNRLDLQWENPGPCFVRVVRRVGTYPTLDQKGAEPPSDHYGVVVADGRDLNKATDAPLKGETVYYYTLFPYLENPQRVYDFDSRNRTAAMATSPYNLAGQMYDLLPQIYRRYDNPAPPADKNFGQDQPPGLLRRFLDLPGGQLDLIYSFARSLLDLHSIDRVDGRLLPLLAQWIGWQTDFRQELDQQRNEIRHAVFIYKSIGTLPGVEATIRRMLGWDNYIKEFVHNVFISNRPERLNLWLNRGDDAGNWSESGELLSLDFAHQGRASAARDEKGLIWLFYHTSLAGQAAIHYKTYEPEKGWSGSRRLTTGRRMIPKYPSAVFQGRRIWVFWTAYGEEDQKWSICFQSLLDGRWSAPECLLEPSLKEYGPAWAATDNQDGLWVFWLEQVRASRQLEFKRYAAGQWGLPFAFPPDQDGSDPRVESDPFILFVPELTEPPAAPKQNLWVFWARHAVAGDPGRPDRQTRWEIAYRVKKTLDPAVSDWAPVLTLAKDDPDCQDREPAALSDAEGNIELFWSSDRSGSWSIWTCKWNQKSQAWSPARNLTANPFSQRAPLPLKDGAKTLLVFRANNSLSHSGDLSRNMHTSDSRYAGSTSVDTRNRDKIALQKHYLDFQTYTYATGRYGDRSDNDWYNRNTVGIYLVPTTEDPLLIERNQELIRKVLGQFLPIQTRVVFLIEPALFQERIYDYDFSGTESPHYINEQVFDSPIPETCAGYKDLYQDALPDWVWIRSWNKAYSGHKSVDFNSSPIGTKWRSWRTDIHTGGSNEKNRRFNQRNVPRHLDQCGSAHHPR